jgi:heparan-alpha-glucosaminide N-acetyltransferase
MLSPLRVSGAVCAVICLLFYSAGAGANVAHVGWKACNEGNLITNVTISNSTVTLTVPGYNFTNVSLPAENGPGSYWTVQVNCIVSVSVEGAYVFLNSTSPGMYYSLVFYGDCGQNKSLKLFTQSLNQLTPPAPRLGIDEALLVVNNSLSFPVAINQKSDNCYKCMPFYLGEVVPGQNWNVVLDTTFAWTIYVEYNTSEGNLTLYCKKHHYFSEHSQYVLNLDSDTRNCSLEHQNMVSSYTTYLPILYAAVGILGLALVWGVTKVLWLVLRDKGCFHYLHFKSVDRVTARDLGNPRKVNSEYGAVNPQETEPLNRTSVNGLMAAPADQSVKSGSGGGETSSKTPPGRRRLASLDTFRGFSLMIMIFVNYGGGGYWFFDHSRWNGLTVADLVFPWFIWIMGVSIVFSYKRRTKHTVLSRLYQLVRRSVILFGLGLFLNNGFTLGRWRIPGVLQRFAISYFVVALTELLTSEIRSSLVSLTPKGRILGIFRDVTSNVFQWAVVFLLEFLWLALTFLLPLPHPCPRGYLGPGGLADSGRYCNCSGGAAGVIDRWLFTDNHIYQTPTAKETYHLLRPYDPEGILGSLNSIILCFLGVQAGRILVLYKNDYNIIIRFLLWGLLLVG